MSSNNSGSMFNWTPNSLQLSGDDATKSCKSPVVGSSVGVALSHCGSTVVDQTEMFLVIYRTIG